MQLFAMFSGKRAVKHALTGCGGLLCVTRLYVNSFLSEHGTKCRTSCFAPSFDDDTSAYTRESVALGATCALIDDTKTVASVNNREHGTIFFSKNNENGLPFSLKLSRRDKLFFQDLKLD